jgi:hypothetical protein
MTNGCLIAPQTTVMSCMQSVRACSRVHASCWHVVPPELGSVHHWTCAHWSHPGSAHAVASIQPPQTQVAVQLLVCVFIPQAPHGTDLDSAAEPGWHSTDTAQVVQSLKAPHVHVSVHVLVCDCVPLAQGPHGCEAVSTRPAVHCSAVWQVDQAPQSSHSQSVRHVLVRPWIPVPQLPHACDWESIWSGAHGCEPETQKVASLSPSGWPAPESSASSLAFPPSVVCASPASVRPSLASNALQPINITPIPAHRTVQKLRVTVPLPICLGRERYHLRGREAAGIDCVDIGAVGRPRAGFWDVHAGGIRMAATRVTLPLKGWTVD